MSKTIEQMWADIYDEGRVLTGEEIIAQMWADIAAIDQEQRSDEVLRCIEAELVELPPVKGGLSLLESIEDFLPEEKEWFQRQTNITA